MNNFTLYLRTNTINGKHYVGQTSNFKNRERDWRCLKKKYANKYLDSDREQYGLDNWSVEILAECDTREESWSLEQYYIEHYNTIYPNGYNLEYGGNKGKQLSEETRKKMSDAKKGKIPKAKPPKQVYQYTLEGELVKVWESTMECDRNRFSSGTVSQCCNNRFKREGNNIYKGFIWSYSPLP